MKEALKFPSGQFTHSDLAKHNGQTNQQVWIRYQEAIKAGVIKYVGDRKNSTGRGKSSKLYELVSGAPQPLPVVVVTPIPPAVVVVVTPDEPSTVPIPSTSVEPEPVIVMKAILPPEPVIVEETPPPVVEKPVEVLKIEDPKKAEKNDDENFIPRLEEPKETTFLCPCCERPMLSLPQGKNRVTLFCNQSLDVCPTRENPKRNASNEKEAYEYIKSIWTKKVSEYAPVTAGA